MHFQDFSVGAMNNDMFDLLRIILKWRCKIKLIFFSQCIQNRSCKASFICAGLPSGHSDRTIQNTERWIRDHQFYVKFHLISESVTIRAGTKRIIKGKTSRLDLIDTHTTVRTGKTLAETQQFSINHFHKRQTICQAQYIFQ